MKLFLLIPLIAIGISLPPLAQAGGYGFSMPHLTWPTPDTVTRDCSTTTQISDEEPPCPDES